MAKVKEKWNPTISHIVPKGTKLADGTILDKETTLTQEEFTKNPPVIPAGHPYYNLLARISREEIEKEELQHQETVKYSGFARDIRLKMTC